MDCESKLLLAEYMLEWAVSLIAKAVELMDFDQFAEWAGVRAWQESVPTSIDDSDEKYRVLAELLDNDDGWKAFVAYKKARATYLRIRRNLTTACSGQPNGCR